MLSDELVHPQVFIQLSDQNQTPIGCHPRPLEIDFVSGARFVMGFSCLFDRKIVCVEKRLSVCALDHPVEERIDFR